MGFLSGKKKSQSSSQSTSSSSNRAYPLLEDSLGSNVGFASQGNTAIADLLGLNGTGQQSQGFQNYLDSTGYNFIRDEGLRDIDAGYASSGLLNSGARDKARIQYASNVGNTFFGDYMDRLFGLSGQGYNAAQVISGAGGVSQGQSSSNSTSSSTQGLGSFLGPIASTVAASDRRLKTNIKAIGSLPNGLTIYEYNYISNGNAAVGVMADEVASIVPEALGPVVNGFATVDYAKLGV